MSQKKRDEQAARQHADDLKWLLDQPQGRRLLWAWLNAAQVFDATASSDAGEVFRFEGKRAFGVLLMSRAQEIDPVGYALMVSERMDDLVDEGLRAQGEKRKKKQDDEGDDALSE